GSFPRPSICAWPSSVPPANSDVTLQCSTPAGEVDFRDIKFVLRKNNASFKFSPDSPGGLAEFHLRDVKLSDAGEYTCEYYRTGRPTRRSPPSDVLLLLVTGFLPKPSLHARPGRKVTAGGNVTLQCQKPSHVTEPHMFALLKKGTSTPIQLQSAVGMETDFFLPSVTGSDTGAYSCVYHQPRAPFWASEPSDHLSIWVTEFSFVLRMWHSTASCLMVMMQCAMAHFVLGSLVEPEEVSTWVQYGADGMFLIRNCSSLKTGGKECDFNVVVTSNLWGHMRGRKKWAGTKKPPPTSSCPSSWGCKTQTVLESSGRLSMVAEFLSLLLFAFLLVFTKCKGKQRPLVWSWGASQGVSLNTYLTKFLVQLICSLQCYGCIGISIWIFQGSFPRPSICAWPSSVPPANSDVTLRCSTPAEEVDFRDIKFVLRKNNASFKFSPDSPGGLAEFHLSDVKLSDAGEYTCDYRTGSPTRRSPPSDVLLLLVTGFLPKPSLHARPGRKVTAGENVTLQCQKPSHVTEPHMFALLKKGTSTPIRLQSAVGMETDFFLPSVTGSDTGAYSCVYHQPRAPFWASEPSDHLSIWVTGSLPRPSIHSWPSWVVPANSHVTLQCSIPIREVIFRDIKFALRKNNVPLESLPSSDSPEGLAEFHLSDVKLGDAGEYTCEYYRTGSPTRRSPPSDVLLLLVTGFFPKPSLHARPGWKVTAGGNVTLQCEKPSHVTESHMFALLKKGTSTPIQLQSAVGMETDFSLPSVTGSDTGAYSCVYYQPRAPFWASEPSDHLMISVTESLPRPSIHAWPSWVVPANSNVTLRCSTPTGEFDFRDIKFALRKNNVPLESSPSPDSPEGLAEFHLSDVKLGDAGEYTCEYRTGSPTRRSPPSDVLLLLVTGNFPKPSLKAHQSGEMTAGENVTLQCQLPRHVTEPHMFALLKKGTSTPIKLQGPVGMDTDFYLLSVTGSDTGAYSCVYYQPKAAFLASEPSDHLSIWVTESFPRPSIHAWPSSMVPANSNVTVRCSTTSREVNFRRKHDSAVPEAQSAVGMETDFSLPSVTGSDTGAYSCVYYQPRAPFWASEPSDHLMILVTDSPGATSTDYTTGNLIRLCLSAVIMVLMVAFLLEACWSQKWSRCGSR
uniref:Ig-like domain-containing protein n=1 Tax=Myotis lucifugus TaxID=59463 RepID=G1Q3I6_MYOLU